MDGAARTGGVRYLQHALERHGCHDISVRSWQFCQGYFDETGEAWTPPYWELAAYGWQSDIGKKLIEDLAEWKTRALEYAYLLQAHGIRLDGGIQEAR